MNEPHYQVPYKLKYVRNIYYLPETKINSGKENERVIPLRPVRIKDLREDQLNKILFNISKGLIRPTDNYTVEQLKSYVVLELRARMAFASYIGKEMLKGFNRTHCNKEMFDILNKDVKPLIKVPKSFAKRFDTSQFK